MWCLNYNARSYKKKKEEIAWLVPHCVNERVSVRVKREKERKREREREREREKERKSTIP